MQGSFEIILESSFCREGTLLLLIKRHFQEPIWKEQGKILDLIDNFIENNLQMKSWNRPKLPFNLSLVSIFFFFSLILILSAIPSFKVSSLPLPFFSFHNNIASSSLSFPIISLCLANVTGYLYYFTVLPSVLYIWLNTTQCWTTFTVKKILCFPYCKLCPFPFILPLFASKKILVASSLYPPTV